MKGVVILLISYTISIAALSVDIQERTYSKIKLNPIKIKNIAQNNIINRDKRFFLLKTISKNHNNV